MAFENDADVKSRESGNLGEVAAQMLGPTTLAGESEQLDWRPESAQDSLRLAGVHRPPSPSGVAPGLASLA